MYCKQCGTELRENSLLCNNCGEYQGETEKKVNTSALVGLTLACISLFWNFFAIPGLLALFLSCCGLEKVIRSHSTEKGRSIAIVGITLSLIACLQGLLIIMFVPDLEFKQLFEYFITIFIRKPSVF